MQDSPVHFSKAADSAAQRTMIHKGQAIETVARGYDGTEKATNRLRALYVSFHQALWSFAHGGKRSTPLPWVERDLMSVSVYPTSPSAYQMAYNMLGQIQTRFVDRCEKDPSLLSISDPGYRFHCAGAPHADAHLLAFIKEGFQRGIYLDDMILTRGKTDDGHSAILVAIPRLQKELLFQGSVIRVGPERKGPLFYATFDEGKYPTAFSAEPCAESLWSHLMPSGYPADKVKITARERRMIPLSHAIILAQRERYAAAHKGGDPRRNTGCVDGLPNEKWALWDDALKTGYRLPEGEMTDGLAGLFAKDVIAPSAQSKNQTVTLDQLLTAALLYASRHELTLPDTKSGLAEGMEPLDWKAIDNRMRYKSHGTDLPANGLRQLYYIYGLYGKKNPNLDVIVKACANVVAGRPHGLTPEPYRALAPARHPLGHKHL